LLAVPLSTAFTRKRPIIHEVVVGAGGSVFFFFFFFVRGSPGGGLFIQRYFTPRRIFHKMYG
jgi:hypothetical protein